MLSMLVNFEQRWTSRSVKPTDFITFADQCGQRHANCPLERDSIAVLGAVNEVAGHECDHETIRSTIMS